jgi:hypothetical protein
MEMKKKRNNDKCERRGDGTEEKRKKRQRKLRKQK